MSISIFHGKSILILFALAFFLFSCKEPADNSQPEDQLASYTSVTSERTVIPGLSAFGFFRHFLVDSNIYLLSSWTRLNELKLAVIDPDANVTLSKTFYTSFYDLSVSPVYDPERDYFYVSGRLDYDTNLTDSDPLFIVIDRDGNLVYEKTYSWKETNNGVHSVVLNPGHDPVLLAYDRVESIGFYGQQKYSMIFLDHNFDSVGSCILPFDSCAINFIDILDNEKVRIVATKTDSAVITTQYTHKFYAELDLEGNVLSMENLSPEINDHIYYENSRPMNYYNWYAMNNKAIALQKYSGSTSLVSSVSIENLPVKYPFYNFGVTFDKDKFSGQNLLFGDFYDIGGPQKPVFHANYLIKFNDDGLEEYRVKFDDDLSGFMRNGPYISVTEEDHYVFLYLFQTDSGSEDFCFSEINIE